MANKNYKGTIDLSNFTTTAYMPSKDTISLINSFQPSGKVVIQMGSDDLSGAVTVALQVSVDGSYWDTAQEDGTDITFSVSTTTPVVQVITGVKELYYRLAVTINSKTGTIDYSIKDVDW